MAADCPGVLESETVIARHVIAAYRSAHYSFVSNCRAIDLRVGQLCPQIEPLLQAAQRPTAFCITAWNPLGIDTTDEQNQTAQSELLRSLNTAQLRFLPASGADPEGAWGPEPGFLVFGLTCAEAIAMGNRFRQNALLWIGPDTVPRLLLLR